MRHERTVAARQKLLDRLEMTGELLRGSLLQRTIRNHAAGCAKCASGEGHPLSVLRALAPAGGRQAVTRAFDEKVESIVDSHNGTNRIQYPALVQRGQP